VTMAQEGGEVVSLMHRPLLPSGSTPGTHFIQIGRSLVRSQLVSLNF